ncbi:phage protein, HK97 gp10 family [Bradyrhizobium sp. YR681]|uniref:HK97-gp10 family putative phage morphogenesis protein n=1 Tax=Bradyrhizobium sp. YR681 TaxID=1144344 RepID=UPI0002711492|nr:HK97-gp10 family putative phage morphogenesis protein [Bradyrhizobium sp. YR681]EJN11854.1 phage protein, HK97 gp10 family [Bradyrhizobium sp. YR681]
MGNNPSVKQFKTDMLSLKNQVAKKFRNQFLAQAAELRENIQVAIQHNITGHLHDSVRVKDVSTDTKPSVLVLAGGPLTTKRTDAGAFDYALAEEFGTVKEEALPFFYPTVRGYKNAFREGARETFQETIEESNKIRAARASNSGAAGQTAAYRGALTLRRS